MSQKIQVITPHRRFEVDRAVAQRKVDSGAFKWENRFLIRERSDNWTLPRSAAFAWTPKMSGNYLVMQARWGTAA